jgi:pimeloyl-ACP methyl ester carboxylesterase
MIASIDLSATEKLKSCAIALHCSLGSGRQWTWLTEALGRDYRVIAPDMSGYGDNPGPSHLPTTLAEEVELLSDQISQVAGPLHLIGHSYGGAVAFKIATISPFASRVRSLTLIEPVLPTLLQESWADRRLHEGFVRVAHEIYEDLLNGLLMEALGKFTRFWNGSAPPKELSPGACLRMIEHVEKVAFDFVAVLAEEDVAAAASAIRVPTLLFSGGLSPYMTQRIVGRLSSLIAGAEVRHLPAAGHMMPFSHADKICPEILRHIARAEDLAQPLLAASLSAGPLEATRRDHQVRSKSG